MKKMNKKELITQMRKVVPLRSIASWNKMSKVELQNLYDEGKRVGCGVLQ